MTLGVVDTLKNQFLGLLHIAIHKNASMENFQDRNHQNPKFRMNLLDWKLTDMIHCHKLAAF